MNIAAQNKMSGRYNVLLYRDGALHKDCGWSENLILDSGLDYLFSTTANLMGRAEVGTGTTVAVVTQTQLTASLGSGPPTGVPTAITAVNAGTPTFASKLTYSFTFTQGAIIGNITEVGVGPAGAGALFSRALIVGVGGTPISVAVASIDQVIVLYELTVTPILTDTTGTIVFNGVSTTYVARAYDVNNFGTFPYSLFSGFISPRARLLEVYGGTAAASSATLVALTSVSGMTPLTTVNASTATTNSTYTPGSFSTTTQVVWNNTAANENIGGVNLQNTGSNKYQISFSPAIAKTDTQALTINFTTTVVRA